MSLQTTMPFTRKAERTLQTEGTDCTISGVLLKDIVGATEDKSLSFLQGVRTGSREDHKGEDRPVRGYS
jgi:hypothetical protein